MGKSSPSAPAAPDPTITAQAQTASNVDTARMNAQLNRVNQSTPWGNLNYSQSQSNPDTWNSTITLSPDQQNLLNSSNQISQSMANLGQNQLGNVSNTLGKPLDLSGAPKLQSSVNSGGVQSDVQPYGQIQNSMDNSNLNPMQTSANYGQIQNNLDLSKVPGMIGGDALNSDLNTQRDSLYNQQAAYLDPQWAGRQHDLENQLTQQGVMQNSEAWNRASDEMNRQRSFDYNQARQSAITGGGAEQSRLFGLGLASNQNAYNQALGTGNFANSAQNQGYNQAMGNANLNNNVNNTQFNQNAAGMQLANAAQQQGYGQNLSNMQAHNTAQNQSFSQGMMNAQLANSARGQDINELMMQRQNPLNELNALRTGSQVTSPQFGGVPGTNMANTDVMSPINAQYKAQMDAYNAQVQQNNGITGGLFSLGSAALPFLL